MAARSHLNSDKENFHSRLSGRYNQPCDKQDSYHYLIEFRIDSVEFEFVCNKSGSCETFKGLGAINKYFDMLAPNQGASTLPDVWDGYYRITLVQFTTPDHPEKLRKKLDSFQQPFIKTQVSGALFKSLKLDLNRNPEYRLGHDFSKEPVALYVTASSDLAFERLLTQIKAAITPTTWTETPRSELHMNIRLYPGKSQVNSGSGWTWKNICKLGLPGKVIQYPVAFCHSMFDIVLSRGDCKKLYKPESSNPWWLGVTKLHNRCSGCETYLENETWQGVCQSCGQYERIKPICPIQFSGTINDFGKIEHGEVNSSDSEKQKISNSEFVSKCELWKKGNLVQDTLIVAMSENVPKLIVQGLLKKLCPDILFIQHSTEDEGNINEIEQIPMDGKSYIYRSLVKQEGLYYDSAKLEFVALIDTTSFEEPIMHEFSEKTVHVDTKFYSQQYSVLLRRKYARQEKKEDTTEYDSLPEYSFIAMSRHAPISCPEGSKKEMNDFFWKCISQTQKKIRPRKNALFPVILAIHREASIETKDDDLPETWVRCNYKTEKQKKVTGESCLCYCDSDTYPKMLMDGLQYFDPYSQDNYTNKQWKKLKDLRNQQTVDLVKIANHQFGMAFLGFKR